MSPHPRPRGAAALAGAAAIGLTAAGWLDVLPVALRAVVLLAGAWAVPAYLLLPAARRCGAASNSAAASLSFFAVLSLHAIVSELLRSAGASFATYDAVLTWILLLGLLAAGAVTWRKSGYRGEWRALRATVVRRRWLVAAIFGLAAIAAWSRGGFTVEEDAFDHIGHVRRIVDLNAMRPEHTLAMPSDAVVPMPPDPRKGALHPLIAWVATTADVGPDVAWSVLPLLLYPALVLAFVAFTQTVLARASLVAIAVALFMLSYGGTALQFAHAAAYGQNLAAGWYWVLAAVVLGGARNRSGGGRARWAAMAILAFGGALVHVGVALHAAILAASVVAFARWLGRRYRDALVTALILVGAAGLGALARLGFERPGANLLHAHVQGVLFVGPDHFVMSPMEILRQFGMVFLGSLLLVPVLAACARRRSDARAVLALCVLPLVVAFVPPLATAVYGQASYMLSRALLNAPVFAAAAMLLAAIVTGARRGDMITRTAAALAVAIWALAFVRPAVDATRADVGRKRPPLDSSLRALVDEVARLPDDAVVLSDPATSYLLSAFCSNRVVASYEQHGNPRDAYPLDRLQAVRDVLSPFAEVHRGVEACRRFGVRYVVVCGRALTASPGFMSEWDARLFAPSCERLRTVGGPYRLVSDAAARESMRWAIFAVMPKQAVEIPPDRAPPPVIAGSVAVLPCEVAAPDLAFEVAGIAVAPPSASPGDSVTITLAYRRDIDTPFGFPSWLHVRFDHATVVGATSVLGDKYKRRFEERRGGYVARFRADLQPGRGVFEPDLWPIGTPLYEVFPFVIPAHARAGRYQVEVSVERDAMLPNFHARDLLYNRDHYSGTACAVFEVRPRGEAGE